MKNKSDPQNRMRGYGGCRGGGIFERPRTRAAVGEEVDAVDLPHEAVCTQLGGREGGVLALHQEGRQGKAHGW